jgi:glycosyltransferase involved in cell wall biosynthesis
MLKNAEKIDFSTFLITLPALNEEKVIKENLNRIIFFINKTFPNLVAEDRIKYCVAINGSTDRTKDIVVAMQEKNNNIRFTFTSEAGRGRALYNTWNIAQEDVLIYTDSDLAYQVEDIASILYSYLDKENFDMVVGSRRLPGSKVIRDPLRKFLTEGYNIFLKILFFNKFTDAQAGHKSIVRKTYLELNSLIKNYDGWFFDTALLLYCEKNGFKIKDICITCIDNRKWRLKLINTVCYFLINSIFLRIKTLFLGWK